MTAIDAIMCFLGTAKGVENRSFTKEVFAKDRFGFYSD